MSHDYVKKEYQHSEDVFKAAMFKHKVFNDPEIAMYMQRKQFELLTLDGGAPMMPPPMMPPMDGRMPGFG